MNNEEENKKEIIEEQEGENQEVIDSENIEEAAE